MRSMLRGLLTIAVTVVAFAPMAHAARSPQAANDPYHRRAIFGQDAKYAGQDVDLSTYRNLISLSDSAIVVYGFAPSVQAIDRNFYYVANFRHDEKHWVAKIPKSGVESSIFQFQTLSTLARWGVPNPVINWLKVGHVQRRFIMKPGREIELHTQDLSQPHRVVLLRDFIYALFALNRSSEAGKPFDPVGQGLHRGYGESRNFQSTQDSAAYFHKIDLNVQQFSLALTPEQGDVMLRSDIEQSLTTRENEIYNTLFDSCVVAAMKGIYSAVPDTNVVWYGRIWRNWRWFRSGTNAYENNPRAVVALLTKQGYIDTSKALPNLEVEVVAPAREVSPRY